MCKRIESYPLHQIRSQANATIENSVNYQDEILLRINCRLDCSEKYRLFTQKRVNTWSLCGSLLLFLKII